MQLFILFSLILFVNRSDGVYLREKPDFLPDCLLADDNFNTCYADNFQTLFRQWKDGVPGLKSVGSLDPLQVNRVKISQNGSGNINIRAELANVVVKGASTAIVKEARLSRKDYTTKLRVLLPKLRFDCDYKLDGRVLSIAMKGQGKAFFETENVLLNLRINNKLRDAEGFTFADIESLNVELLEISGFRIHLDNLFEGQKDLEDSVNELFNKNWREFYETMRPVVEQTMNTVLLDRFKKIFNYVPANYFAADIPKASEVYG